jgi:hypothetical protein
MMDIVEPGKMVLPSSQGEAVGVGAKDRGQLKTGYEKKCIHVCMQTHINEEKW